MISLLKANMSFIERELNLKFSIMSDRLKNKLGLAFPISDMKIADNMKSNGMNPFGMTKRFYAACAAMQGILASWPRDLIPETKGIKLTVKMAYEIADEMLKQENE